MKLSILNEDLTKALAVAGRAVESRPTLPVLSHVLVHADSDTVAFCGTNLEQFIVKRCTAHVEEDGSLCVPWKLFNDLAKSFPGERVDLTVTDGENELLVQCGKAEATLKGIPADEFPALPKMMKDGTKIGEFGPDELALRLSQVVYAASNDESRPILTGVYVESKEGALSLVAADGYRLAWRHDETDLADGSFVLPGKSARDLVRLLASETEGVSLFTDDDRRQAHWRLRSSDCDLVTQLIEGHYVNYRQIVPETYTTQVFVDRDILTRTVKTADLFSETHILTVTIAEHNADALSVTAEGVEVGTFDGTVPISKMEGDPVCIAFNAEYLQDALDACGTSLIIIEFTGRTRPGVIRPVGNDHYLCVIMPMHLRTA